MLHIPYSFIHINASINNEKKKKIHFRSPNVVPDLNGKERLRVYGASLIASVYERRCFITGRVFFIYVILFLIISFYIAFYERIA